MVELTSSLLLLLGKAHIPSPSSAILFKVPKVSKIIVPAKPIVGSIRSYWCGVVKVVEPVVLGRLLAEPSIISSVQLGRLRWRGVVERVE